MSKKIFCLLGNGFTIDFLSQFSNKEIDVSNLFRFGDHVLHPAAKKPGFLSFRWCKELWLLGGRPQVSYEESVAIIEEVITCMNVQYARKLPQRDGERYRKAYAELAWYLKFLFVHYNESISNVELDSQTVQNWKWLRWLQHLDKNEEIEEIHIVTYNYDLWLERTLTSAGVGFQVIGVENGGQSAKLKIYKPHGSIDFAHINDNLEDAATFAIHAYDPHDAQKDKVKKVSSKYEKYWLQNLMIPPAGEATRVKGDWAGGLRESIIKCAENLIETDEVYIAGISYGSVDRFELDEILTSINSNCPVHLVNPRPSRIFSAVLASLFIGFISYTNIDPIYNGSI